MIIYQLSQYLRFLTRHHLHKLMAAVIGALILALSAFQAGQLKPSIHWLDVAGEGTAALLALCWLLLLLCARPPGKVTSQLYAGALLYWFACLLDVVDEFIHYPAQFRLFADIESIAIPVAMLLVTIGLWEWLKEQKLINRLLNQRELIHREYDLLDPLTQLYGEAYLVRQLQAIAQRKQSLSCELLMFDLSISPLTQDAVSQQQQLARFSELMLTHLQSEDVLCRCGASRFALLLTDIGRAQAKHQFEQIIADIQSLMPIHVSQVQRTWQCHNASATQFVSDTELALQTQLNQSSESGLC